MDRVAGPDSSALPVLSDTEAELLRVLSEDGPLTVGQLMTLTGYSREELGMAVGGLRAKGLVSRLNTLVESYCCRFPGLGMNQK